MHPFRPTAQEARQLVSRNRPLEEISLPSFAADLPKSLKLPGLLNSLRHSAQLQLLAHGDDGPAQRQHVLGAVDRSEEALVDLDGVQAQLLEHVESRVEIGRASCRARV